MSNIWFSSDFHAFHRNIRVYCPNRPGGSLEEMTEILIENWNSVVKSEDRVYFLGDLAITGSREKLEYILDKLQGRKYMIRGNHDCRCKKEWFFKYWEWIKDYHELRVQDPEAQNGKSQLIVMQHYAPYVWRDSHRGSWSLFGHSHGSLDEWSRDRLSIDVGVDSEHTNYFPISCEQIKKIMKEKLINFVDHHNENTDREIKEYAVRTT